MAGYPPYATAFPHPYAPVAYLPTVIQTTVPSTTTSHWVEHTSHDGRKYYYNAITQQTTWEKPQELKTSKEIMLSSCPWKEFKSETGKSYYYNEQSKQSVWVKPQELVDSEMQAESNNVPPVPDTKELSVPLLETPCTPATPKEDPSKPPEPSAIEKAMLATLASYDIPGSQAANDTDTIPIPPPPIVETSVDNVSERKAVDYTERMTGLQQSAASPTPVQEYKTRGEMAEGLRRLFRDCNVPGGATWEQALKLISVEPRYLQLKGFTEKKQIFNVYKTQRLKEEREEQRLRAKQAKEDLERFLLRHSKLHSTMSYRKVDQLLSDSREWTVVPDRDRRDLFDDVMQLISKRERDEAKVLRKRNIKVFNEILSGMSNLTYRTTWSEAQQMLLDNTKFTGDVELQSLDKEDALVCFEEHICMLEQEHDEEKERDRRRQKRLQRKNREAFIVLLDELHEQKLLTATSMWKELYSIISRDERFEKMLAQRGSTPLDLFKFYVEALKARYPAEKRIIKEILKDNGFVVELATTFEEFSASIAKDERSKGIDEGNMRMSFDSLLEKAHGRERERQRDDARRLRKLEQNFCEMLCSSKFIGPNTTWEEVRDHFNDHPAFRAMSLESERIRIFKDHLISLESSALAETEKSRRSRKDKHKHRAENSVSLERYDKRKKRPASLSPEPSDASASEGDTGTGSGKRKHRKSKKSKRKKAKHHRHHKTDARQTGDEELEEGEAADEDDEEEDEPPYKDSTARDDGTNSSRRRHKKHRRRAPSSDPEDGEEIDSASEEEVYEAVPKRKRR